VTAPRHRGSRAKRDGRRTTRPGETQKTGAALSARQHPAASWATTPPLRRGGSADRLVVADAGTAPPLEPGTLRALPPAEPSLLERAERLRDDLLRSKLTHPDPWGYTGKARAWAERAQTLVEDIAIAGQTPELHAMVAKLATEVEEDADFQKARQLF
jgi:hypothetical protein